MAELLRICDTSFVNKTVLADWRRATIIPIFTEIWKTSKSTWFI